MKLFSWVVSIIIGIGATLLLKTQILDITTTAIELLESQTNISLADNIFISKVLPRAAAGVRKAASAGVMSTAHRPVRKIFYANEQAEGDGARVRRSIGTPAMRQLSPFLMFDHFNSNSPNGFPDQGQETITYILQGGMDHEDFVGNRGTLNSGDLQFMTAGRGIMHAEMPHVHEDGSRNIGFQLWVDLPMDLKSCEPRYRDLRAAEIPKVDADDGRVTVKVISGQSHGIDSVKDLAYTPVWVLDVEVRPGGKVTQSLPKGWNAFAYVLEGNVLVGEGDVSQRKVNEYNICVFDQEGDQVHFEAAPGATKPARLVIIAGTPLDQPVLQYGPFVVTSKEDVYQAMFDYQTHTNGFERAENWKSEIARERVH